MRALNVSLWLWLLALICCNDFKVTLAKDFGYNGDMGPDHWSEHYSTCSGKHQSPINIDLVNVIGRTFRLMGFKNFGENPTDSEILNNGHTVVVHFEYATGPPITYGGPLNGKFIFEQLHFHWGDNDTIGSEDRINNVSFPAELHMVFRNEKYSSFSEAVTESNGVVVFAYFYEIRERDNPIYDEFLELLGEIPKPNMATKFKQPPSLWELSHTHIDDYYTYTGSLTTPPCSEDVTWIDFKEPIDISAKQIERFRHLYTYDNTPLTHNFRPLQPLNDRTVYSAQQLRWDEGEEEESERASAIPFVDILIGGAFIGKSANISNIVIILLMNFVGTRVATTLA